jgi:hypothetical protein
MKKILLIILERSTFNLFFFAKYNFVRSNNVQTFFYSHFVIKSASAEILQFCQNVDIFIYYFLFNYPELYYDSIYTGCF